MDRLAIRALDAPETPGKEALLLDLWAAVFEPRWMLDAAFLRETLALDHSRPGGILLAWAGEKPAGFAFAQIAFGGHTGAIQALGVLPEYRGRGIGRALHDAAFAFLRDHSALCVQLGAGALRYFWPGVPIEEGGGAWPFFAALGYPETWHAADLAQPLENYATPRWVWERMEGQEVTFGPANPADRPAVLAMVSAQLPAWAVYYADRFDAGGAADIILAKAADGSVLGTCLLDCPSIRWARCFDGPVAAPGCVLTAEHARGLGVGLALTARATEIGRDRGCRTGFIGYTDLSTFYQKLGYVVWQKYVMSERDDV